MFTAMLLWGVAVFLLVAANAFFVAAEFALVSVRDTRIQQLVAQRRIGARTVQKLHRNLDEVLSAVQFGITLASLALGWIGEPAIARMLEPALERVPYAQVYTHVISFTVAFAIITYLHVILGEVVPKSLALQRAERVALAVAAPMDVFMTLSRPALYVMNKSANAVLRAFGSQPVREGGVHSPEELKLIVTASSKVGLLPPLQEDMIHRSLELGNVTAREIMVPRHNIFSLPADLPLPEAMSRVVEEQHSRIPVYDPQLGPEHIVGVLYAKDLSRIIHLQGRERSEGRDMFPGAQVRHIMRSAMVVPESKPVSDLLAEFKQRKRHLAVVVDEFGSTVGVVTVEDAIEQIVGELEDEHDVGDQAALVVGSATMVLDGGENIRDLESQFHIRLPRDQGFETLGGFIMSRLQRIPRGGETFEFDGRRYTVLQMDGHRIKRVKIEALEAQPAERAGD